MTTSRRAFLIGMAIPAVGLNPRATRYLSHRVMGQARTMEEALHLSHLLSVGMFCGFLWCAVTICGGGFLVLAHHDALGTVVALGPWLSLHALWHWFMRR